MADAAVAKAAVVRNEISDILNSDRLTLLGSCEAHVFKLENDKWIDLTSEPVLVHLIRDNLEGMTKMLAVHTHELIIDNVPVSSNFNVFTPSKKFIQFVCNKFDKNSENYGFGFSGLNDLEMFLQLLNRIKQMAMASLTPSLYNNYNPTTPATPNSFISNSSLNVPCGFTSSPMKSHINQADLEYVKNRLYMEEPLSPVRETMNSFSDKSIENQRSNPTPPSDTQTANIAEIEYTDTVTNEASSRSNVASPLPAGMSRNGFSDMSVQARSKTCLITGSGDITLMGYSLAEKRLCDLIASLDVSNNGMHRQNNDSQPDFFNGNIGSPAKRNF